MYVAPRHLVGREAELARLGGLLAADGPAGVVLLGEPGMGKTTLWEQAISLAGKLGRTVLSARAAGAEAGRSFAALGELTEGIDPDLLERLPRPQQRALEVALRRVEGHGAPADPLAISAGFLGALRLLAERQPLLVAIDDVQWLDHSSADVLAFAARRCGAGVRFLLAQRSGSQSELERVLRPGGVARVELRGLTSVEVGRLLPERLGFVPSHRVFRQIFETSQGNPLFALEFGRLASERAPAPAGGDFPLPSLVEEIFGARVRSLPAGGRRVLLAVGLSGGLERRELEKIVDPFVLEDAATAGLVVLDGARVRPSHPLLAAAAREQASWEDRRRLHLDLAEAVDDPVLRARHLASACAGTDPELATVVAEAGVLAAERGATQEAEDLARHALRLTPRGLPARAERVLALASAQLAVGDLPGAGELLAEHLAELPCGHTRARGHILAGQAADVRGELVQLGLALAEAVDDPEVRSDALSRKAMLVATSLVERVDQAESWARQALRAARRAGADAESRALPVLAWCLVMQGRPLDELPQPKTAPGASLYETSMDRPRGVGLAFRGEVAEARRIFRGMVDEAELSGELRALIAPTIQLCELELRCGDVQRADGGLDELSQWTALEEMGAAHARLRSLAAALRGDPPEAVRWAKVVLEAPDLALQLGWDRLESERSLGISALLTGDWPEAVLRLQRVWDHALAQHVHDPGAFPVAGDLVEALLQTGAAASAAEVADRLRQAATEQRHPWGLATAKRCHALIELHTGHCQAAARSLSEAAEAYGGLGLRFDRARTLLALGRAQRRAKQNAAACRSFEESAAELDALGCGGWAAAARAELARIGGRRQSEGDRLTPSERRTVDLAVDGMSNKEIAAHLFLSVYTVQEHLSHAYAKLGVRSRSQLASALRSAAD